MVGLTLVDRIYVFESCIKNKNNNFFSELEEKVWVKYLKVSGGGRGVVIAVTGNVV